MLSWVDISVHTTQVVAANPGGSAGLGGRGIAPLFTPEVQYWSSNIVQWSQQTGIDANMIATLMQIESCGDPFAESSAGAMGLFQVMPYHFESGEDPYKPATNAQRGLDYLQRALAARDGVARLGFAGYNGGITGAKRPESQWTNETQRFVYWGTGIYQDAVKGKGHSERLEEWLGRGGASLCNQAAQRLGINP
jgi:soluble lytic murein transglycosylase-like protein